MGIREKTLLRFTFCAFEILDKKVCLTQDTEDLRITEAKDKTNP